MADVTSTGDWQEYEERYRTGYYEEIVALGETTLPPLLSLLRNHKAIEMPGANDLP